MRRFAVLSTMLGLACSLLLIPGTTAQAAAPTVVKQAAARKVVPTNYGLHAMGYGTMIKGGDLPLASGATGYQHIACTTLAGLNRQNGVASVNIPGLGTINGVRTRVWTTKRGRTVSSHSQHSIAGITLLDAELFKLELSGLSSKVRVWKDGAGYHATASHKVLGLRLTLPDQAPVELDLPLPGQPLEIPGLLRIHLGESKKIVRKSMAFARAQALQVEVLPTRTKIKVGLSRARIAEGIINGIFSGRAAGLEAKILDPVVRLGKTPLKNLPCEGTDGEAKSTSLVNVGIPGAVGADAAKATVFGKQWGRRSGRAWSRAEIADVSLLGGVIVVKGIRAQANVIRRPGKLIRNKRGTSTLRIVVNGEEVTLPPLGAIEIPGIVKIQEGVVRKFRGGIEVVALRLTLLDPDNLGAVVDLGIANAAIRKAITP